MFYVQTKLNQTVVSDAQFKIDEYHFPPFKKDKNAKGGGKIVFIGFY